MSVHSGPEIVNDNLVFKYDMANTEKSWKGKPTTNFSYTQNPRIDASYAPYSATSSGTWNAKHPEAIRVYNDLGSDISAYSNTGVTDWTNTYHAIWTLDTTLNRPVVTMRDFDGNWKAKSFGLGQTMTSMGLGYGSTYTISWLQWTDDIAKSTNAGLYGANTGGSNNFHDGLSNSFATSYNTLPNTWQRVYATFTVSSAWNLAAGLSCYMYGHYIKRGTVKVADVQVETGIPSGFSKQQTRSNTQAILDITGNNTVTAASLTYASNNTFSFDGSSNYIDSGPIALTGTATQSITWACWVRPTTGTGDIINMVYPTAGWNMCPIWASGQVFYAKVWSNPNLTSGTTFTLNQYYYLVLVRNNATNTNSFYINGQLVASNIGGYSSSGAANNHYFGRAGSQATNTFFNGQIPTAQIYTRALLADEIQQNFAAYRTRFGI
jgi:hypothetical protein